ncbi:MAG: DMT family transporter [Bacteroidales bacterium]|nr:DMT family transporter [Bacteroidales bacterium]
MFVGEFIALGVAVSWTATALFAEVASKRMGSLPLNTLRMTMSLALLAVTLWLMLGEPWPRYADGSTWLWLALSGVVGYVIGDYCLMQGYIYIGSRFGQLFMTLSAPTAAITGRLLLGEQMGWLAIVGMVVTLSGIAMSILSGGGSESEAPQPLSPSYANSARHKKHSPLKLKLPAKGIFFASMAGICQGFGLVLSKMGLGHYSDALTAAGMEPSAAPDGALLPIPLQFSIPFAATMIRASVGLVGFFVLLVLFNRDWRAKLNRASHDRRAMWCLLGATVFGPFVGVSASLLATQYTTTGIAQTLFALTPVLIIAPAAWLFHQRVTVREVIGAVVSVAGVCLFFV